MSQDLQQPDRRVTLTEQPNPGKLEGLTPAGSLLLPLATLAALLALTIWGYWPALVEMADLWKHDPQYTHGFLVPAFAIGLLWYWRKDFPGFSSRLCWSACLVVAGAVLFRLLGAYYYFEWLGYISFLAALAGTCLLVCGWKGLCWAGLSIAYLFFMLPLPYGLQVAMAPPLQRLATRASVYALQTMGYCAVPEGNNIVMTDVKLSVVQACSGLSMLLTFFALATGLALVIRRPLRDRVAIVLSAAPIALLTNVGRITVTGVCHKLFGAQVANAVFHDLAGWLMMPAALVMIGLELALLARILIDEKPNEVLAFQPLLVPVKGLSRLGQCVTAAPAMSTTLNSSERIRGDR
jgi:exosortase